MSDIKFGTDGWRAIIARDFTTANVARVAEATALWQLAVHKSPSVIIGYDCRFGGELFTDVVARVLCSKGIKVYVAGSFVSTPMISLAARDLRCGAGIIITASHNPASYNGYKLKSGYGGPSTPDEIQKVESLIPETTVIPEKTLADFSSEGLLEWVDLESMYFDKVDHYFDLKGIRNSGIRIAYDSMFGSGQNMFYRIFPEAIHLHHDHNPSFHGQAPEPLEKNLQELADIIKKDGHIDCGIATDGDADRLGMFDEKGRFVDSHHLILLLIHYLKKYKQQDGKVVVAFSATDKVKKLCHHYGLECVVTKIGFKYIAELMIKDDVLLGGEESGGIAVKGHLPERDGIWNALVILEFMTHTGKKLSELVDEVYKIVGAFNYSRNDLHLDEAQKKAVIERCASGAYSRFGAFEILETESIDGFKFHLPEESWVMVRPSGTEPVLRIYAQGKDETNVKAILKQTKETLLG